VKKFGNKGRVSLNNSQLHHDAEFGEIKTKVASMRIFRSGKKFVNSFFEN
jgi:hypothetical protein